MVQIDERDTPTSAERVIHAEGCGLVDERTIRLLEPKLVLLLDTPPIGADRAVEVQSAVLIDVCRSAVVPVAAQEQAFVDLCERGPVASIQGGRHRYACPARSPDSRQRR